MIAKKIKVLYVSYDGMTDNLGKSQVIPYLKGLSSHGYEFTILSCEKSERLKTNGKETAIFLKSIGINWEPIIYTKRPPVISTLFDFYSLKRKAKELQINNSFKIIHCRSYLPALIGLYMQKKYGIKFIFDMRGFWADERVDGGLWKQSNPIYKSVYIYFKKKELSFLQNADFVISLTKKGKQEMLKWKNISLNPEKIVVIPCCVDTELFNPDQIIAEQQSAIRSELGISEVDFVVSYLGSIGTWYMLDEMLDFFLELKKQKPAARFLFITQNEHALIRETASKKSIADRDIIIRSASRNEVPLLISLSNWSIFFIRPSYSKMSSSPTKQGEIMAMGVPVICNAGVGDTDEIVTNYNSGIISDYYNYQSIVESMQNMNIDPRLIRSGAMDFFSLDKGVRKYAEIYKLLL
jgi:glycosyltransferase involved in cell wall biosynthesis